jgi:hypothetical protein
MKNNLALMPCPLCGCAEIETLLKADELWRSGIRCPACGVMIFGSSDAEVAAKWNKREGT